MRRTARRLASWGAAPQLVAAGLCHAAYGTQGFPHALFTLAEREDLRERLDDETEGVVYAYCATDRSADLHGELRDRFSGEYWAPPARMRRQLAELTAANELDVLEHASLSFEGASSLRRSLLAMRPELSQAARTTLESLATRDELAAAPAAPSCDADLAYRDLGAHGPRVVLWHGGSWPEVTWARQHTLSSTLQLRIPWRRGCAPSTSNGPADWALDTRDLLRLMPHRAHVVAHSYGGVSAVMAAALAPERFLSLTVIEAPLWAIAPDDARVRELAALGRAFSHGEQASRAAFLALAGLPAGTPQTRRIVRLARNFRDPGEAVPRLDVLRASKLPIAIVSGAHTPAIEALSDAFATEIGAERWSLSGAGHAVARVPEFNVRLAEFIARTDAPREPAADGGG